MKSLEQIPGYGWLQLDPPSQAAACLTLPFLLMLPWPLGKPRASQPQPACQLSGGIRQQVPMCLLSRVRRDPVLTLRRVCPLYRLPVDGTLLLVTTGTEPEG